MHHLGVYRQRAQFTRFIGFCQIVPRLNLGRAEHDVQQISNKENARRD